MNHGHTLPELASIVGGKLRRDSGVRILNVATVATAGAADATWVADPSYLPALAECGAGVVLVGPSVGETPMPAIECAEIAPAVARLLAAFAPPAAAPAPGVHPAAVIDPTAELGDGCSIGPCTTVGARTRLGAQCVLHAGVHVGPDCVLGERCVLWPGAVVRERSVLGSHVTLHANAVIGADGFGYYQDGSAQRHYPHIGRVVIEDDVDVGACTCIDRAKVGDTVIGRGTKIDNLVQVAHNVSVGEHCVIAGQSAVAGSARIGRYVVFGGRAGVTDHVVVNDRVALAAGAILSKSTPPGQTVSGIPADEHRKELRARAAMRRLPRLIEQIRDLLARVERLEASMHDRS